MLSPNFKSSNAPSTECRKSASASPLPWQHHHYDIRHMASEGPNNAATFAAAYFTACVATQKNTERCTGIAISLLQIIRLSRSCLLLVWRHHRTHSGCGCTSKSYCGVSFWQSFSGVGAKTCPSSWCVHPLWPLLSSTGSQILSTVGMGQFHRFHHSMFCTPSQLHMKGPPVPLRQLNSLSQNHKKETVQRMQCPLKSACWSHRFIIFIALLSKNDISGQSSTSRKENKSAGACIVCCLQTSKPSEAKNLFEELVGVDVEPRCLASSSHIQKACSVQRDHDHSWSLNRKIARRKYVKKRKSETDFGDRNKGFGRYIAG